MNVSEDDGQTVRAAVLLRENLYLVKDRAIYVTADDGVNEPAAWTINEVSRTVGTTSVCGVDTGEDWAVIAGRAGMYIFDGGEAVKISQEIQPLWDQINWAAGKTLWVRVDTLNKRILCGVPMGAATSPNLILVVDYRSLSDAAEIESLGSVLFSTLSGKLYAVAGRASGAPGISPRVLARWPNAPTARHKYFWATAASAARVTGKSISCPTRNSPTMAPQSIRITRPIFF